MAASELARRVAVAVVAIPVVVVAVYLGGWVLGALLAGGAALGALELYRLAEARGIHPFTWAGAGLAVAFVAVATAVPSVAAATPLLWTLVLGGTLVLAAAAIWLRGVAGGPLAAVAVTMLGAVLLGGTLACGQFLRHLPQSAGGDEAGDGWRGLALVGFPLLLTWVSDSGAYFGGRALGRHKLIPKVSPGKTVEGAVAGVLVSIVAGALLGWVFSNVVGLGLSVAEGAAGGVLISAVAQVGDLAESLFKREAGVKDSGRFFPGHGGMLDRVDSLLFTVPVAFWYLMVVL